MRILSTLFIATVFVIVPYFSFAQTTTNTGLVDHTIWYSKDPFFEGDTIKVYTLLYNSGKAAVSGTVEFYDDKVILGKKDVLISPESAKDIFISWTVTAGEHSISAKFLNPTITVNGKQEPIIVKNNESSERKVFVPKKIVSESKDVSEGGENASTDTVVDRLAEKAAPYTPEPVDRTVIAIDTFREETSVKIAASKETTKARVEAFKDSSPEVTASSSGISVSTETLQKPLAYISLFFWSLLGFIFSHKVVFYGVILVIIIFSIRFVWRRFRRD